MEPTESVRILAETVAVCPEMALAQLQGEMWHQVLGDLRYVDCHQAIIVLVRRGAKFISAGEIYETVREIRTERVCRAEPLPVPVSNPDDIEGYQRELREIVRRAGDGEFVKTLPELTA